MSTIIHETKPIISLSLEFQIVYYLRLSIYSRGTHAAASCPLPSWFALKYIFSHVKLNSLAQVMRMIDNKPPREYPYEIYVVFSSSSIRSFLHESERM